MTQEALQAHVTLTHTVSTSLPPAADTAHKPHGFERKPGLLSHLKERFSNLKAKIDEGRSRAASTRPPPRMSTASWTSLTSHIRRGSSVLRPSARSRGNSAARFDNLIVKPEVDKQRNIERHARLLNAIKTEPSSSFQKLDPDQRKQVLTALDVCTELSDAARGPMEGLLLLKQCLDDMYSAESQRNAENGSRRTSVAHDKMQYELFILKGACNKLLSALITQADAQPQNTKAAKPDPTKSASPTMQQGTKEVDQPASPVADLAKPVDQEAAAPGHIKSVDPAIAEFDELDLLAMDLQKPLPMPATKTAAPVDPALAEFDELDLLAMDLQKSVRKPEATTTAAVLDELDQLTSELNALAGKPDAAQPALVDEASILDELDELTQDLVSSLPPAQPRQDNARTTGANAASGTPTPDRLA